MNRSADEGGTGKLMGHAWIHTTMNVYGSDGAQAGESERLDHDFFLGEVWGSPSEQLIKSKLLI
jgi:hypothetical protein